MKKIFILILFLVGCAIKPVLDPVYIVPQIDIGKDVSMNFVLNDFHNKVVVKNRTNLPGIHHDVDENNFLPLPFVEYLQKSIIENLNNSPGVEIRSMIDAADLLVEFNLEHFDVFRETDGGDAVAAILVGGLLGAALMQEECTAEIKSSVKVYNNASKEQICSFGLDISNTTQFGMNNIKLGYKEATKDAVSDLVLRFLNGLSDC